MTNEIQTESTPGRIYKRENTEENQLGFSIIGKIKIGEKKMNDQGKEYPSSIDYFRATGSHAELFHQTLGEKPNILRIVFPTPFAELCCCQRIEGRDSEGNLAAVSDGLNHKLWDDKSKGYLPATNEQLEEAKTKGIPISKGYGNNAKTEFMKVKNWVERLTLRFIVLEIRGLLGVWELSTNGVASSIPNIIGGFDKMAAAAGRNMNKIVFDLSVAFAKGQKPGSMSRYPVLNLIPNLSYESAMLLNDFKNSNVEYNKLITDDTIGKLLNGHESDLPELPEAVIPNVEVQEQKVTVAPTPQPQVPSTKAVDVKPQQVEPKQTKPTKTTKEEFTPEGFKAWIKEVASMTGDTIPDYMIEVLENALKAISNYNQAKMLAFLEFVCDTSDYSLISKAEAERIIKWVDAVEDDNGDWLPKSMKRIEQAKMIFDYIQNSEQGKLL